MPSTRESLRAKVRPNLQNRTDLDSAIDAGLDAGLEELGLMGWRELRTRSLALVTVAETQTIALPADLEEVLAVQLVDQTSYSGCSVANTGDLLTLHGPASQYANGTKAKVTAGTLTSTGLTSDTWYYLRQGAGTSGDYTYTLYDTASHATTGGTDGLVAITGDGSALTWLVGNGARAYNLEVWPDAEAERVYPAADVADGAQPMAAYRDGSSLRLVPSPSEVWTVRLRYRAKLSMSSGGTDEISSAGFDTLLVAYASAWAFESIERGSESANRWWGIYARAVQAKRRSQGNTGEANRVDTRMAPTERYRDPRVTYWRRGGNA
jgi:hypothetical protein